MPPLSSVLKSREVEDPINLWFNRPLAYAFVALVHRTSITPNQVTLLATLVGVIAAGFIMWGTTSAMVIGGALLWASAILDGADGILARVKGMQSEMGRALDGTADLVVALCALVAASYHLWDKHHDVVQQAVVVVATMSTVFHIYLYDYYKETYLALTRADFTGRFGTRAQAQEKLESLQREQAPLIQRIAAKLYVDLLSNQHFVVESTNRAGLRENLQFNSGEQVATIYRRHNRVAIQLWTWISLAPHSYLFAIFAMVDRLDLYLWLRLLGANSLFVAALICQRRGSERALQELQAHGLGPTPA